MIASRVRAAVMTNDARSWILITLRHNSYCRLCGYAMVAGEEVEYRPSLGHVHPPKEGEYKCHPLNLKRAELDEVCKCGHPKSEHDDPDSNGQQACCLHGFGTVDYCRECGNFEPVEAIK